jgi:hypothetical protein
VYSVPGIEGAAKNKTNLALTLVLALSNLAALWADALMRLLQWQMKMADAKAGCMCT